MKEREIDKWGREIELSGNVISSYEIRPLVKITFAEGAFYKGQRIAPKQEIHNKECLFRNIEDYIFLKGVFKEPPDTDLVGDYADSGDVEVGCSLCVIL